MTIDHNRRRFLRKSAEATGAAALSMLPPSIRQALAIPAHRRTGTIEDVEHIVVLTQENRSFDHYFGAMHGVRGFGDRFPIPVPNVPNLAGKTVWYQRFDGGTPAILSPQHNDTGANFSLIRTADTPHLYPDAQDAWDGGRMSNWPQYKRNASMVYYTREDIPFQYALANAFTICDHHHCSFTGGTNPNRCYLFTGTNHGRDDPRKPGVYNGPALDNAYNRISNGPVAEGYTWTTYAERLQAAGITWRVYRPAAEDYALNPLFGFKSFRDANAAGEDTRTPLQRQLFERGIRSRELSDLRHDVLTGTLPQVSWICASASGSEHPAASSPLQGANYVADVLDALTSNPDVWSKTVLIVNFDENDGFFDHVPPPAPPSYIAWHADASLARFAGKSTVDASDEYLGDDVGGVSSTLPYRHHPYGMGPRVPMYVVSPWSRGGWVNSQVFDNTSPIRFIEKRFGVYEPNISPWRRAVAGDMSTCFDFTNPNDDNVMPLLPPTAALDAKSRALASTVTPPAPAMPTLPVQERGLRRSRALPYELHTHARVSPTHGAIELVFANSGRAAAVFHVYDRCRLDALPRRYTVEHGTQLADAWSLADDGAYDLWVLGPAGYHRHFTGARPHGHDAVANPEVEVAYDASRGSLYLTVRNTGAAAIDVTVTANAYFDPGRRWSASIAPHGETTMQWTLEHCGHWYDFTLGAPALPGYTRRFAGRVETGKDGISDPAMGGIAIGEQLKVSL